MASVTSNTDLPDAIEPDASFDPSKLAVASAHPLYYLTAGSTIVLPIIGTVYAGYLLWTQGISTLDVCLLVGMYFWTVLGIELGFHRYLTHRSLVTGRPMRALLTISGCMAGDGPPIWWTAIHRRHHGHSDRECDPHSPSPEIHGRGFWRRIYGAWHSHIGWMFDPRCTAAYSAHFARDLLKDRTIGWIDRWYFVWVMLGLAIPAALGGAITQSWYGAWTGFIWGGVVRLFLDQHALWWGIVTVCHTIGTRPFRADDDSCNNVLVAVIFLGDGWHNNHHAFPSSAKVGLRWWEFDITWWIVKLLERVGLVWNLKVPTPEAIEAKKV